jgi:hypothetical protein
MRDDGVKLVVTRIPLEELALLHEFEAAGAEVMDVQSLYRFDYARSGPIRTNVLRDDVVVVPYRPDHRADVLELTAASFSQYGHYYADPRLDESTCLAVYVDLARRNCEEPGVSDLVLVAEIDGQTAGYLTFKKHDSPEGPYAAGGIGAVATRFRGRDVFKMLTVSGLQWGWAQGLAWEEHEVLCTNYPVNRSFASLGFGITAAFVTLHLWL